MDYEEFKRHLGKSGLTLREFAALMKLNANSITNYAAARQVPSHIAVVVALLGEMADNNLDFRAVLSRISVKPKRIRGSASIGRFGGNKQIDLLPEQLNVG